MSASVYIAAPSPNLVIAAGAILPPLCTLAVVLRLWNSRRLDDWLTVPALILLWGQGIALIYGTAKHALGYPDPDPPPGVDPDTFTSPESILSSKLFYAIILIQIPCITLIKLAFALFYHRVFVSRTSSRKTLSFLLYGLAGLLLAWGIAFFFAELFLCGADFRAIWLGTDDEQAAECLPFEQFDQALASTDFVFDLIVYLLPIPLVWSLHLSNGQRLGVLGVFSLGGLSIAASITRFVVFTYEANLSFTICVYWTTVESGIALLASCLPSVFGLFKNYRRKLTERSRTYGYSGSGASGKGIMGGFRRASTSWKGRSRLGSDATAMASGPHSSGRKGSKPDPNPVYTENTSLQNLVPPRRTDAAV